MSSTLLEKKRLIAETHAARAEVEKHPKGSSSRSAAMAHYNKLVADYNARFPAATTTPPAPKPPAAAAAAPAPAATTNGKHAAAAAAATAKPAPKPAATVATKAAPAPSPKAAPASAVTVAAKPAVGKPAVKPAPPVVSVSAVSAKPVPSIAAKLQAAAKAVKAQAKPAATVSKAAAAPKKKKKVYGTEDDDIEDAESLDGGEEADKAAEYVDPVEEALELAADSDGAVLTGDAEELYEIKADKAAAKRRLKNYLQMRKLGLKQAKAYLMTLEEEARESVLADANRHDLAQVLKEEAQSDEDYVSPAQAKAAGKPFCSCFVRRFPRAYSFVVSVYCRRRGGRLGR